MKNYLLPVLLFFDLAVNAQSFEKDMELVYKNFVNAGKISYNIKYVLKEGHDVNSKVISQSMGRYIKRDERYMSQYASKYTLVTPKEIIMVDAEEKFICVKKEEQKGKTQPDFLKQLEEYNKGVEKVTRLETDRKNVITYKVELKNLPLFGVTGYEVSINTKTHYMEQVTLLYKKPLRKDPDNNISGSEIPRLEIIFYDFNNPKNFKPSELEGSYYYSAANKKLKATENFKNYNVKEIF
jgi:hypothetical protein